MRSLERLKPMMALDMIVACSLMGMSAVARGHSGVGGGLRLAGRRGDQHPGGNDSKGEPAAPEAAPLRIGAAVKSIERPGGHLGRKGDGSPGAQVLWQGLHQLDAIAEAWRRFGARKGCR
jgi:hypothetical protein